MKIILSSLLTLSLILSLAIADDKESLAVSGLTFEFGDPWIRQQPARPMRAGQLLYDHEDEKLKDIELVLFHFGGSGGSTRANLDRWIGQFSPAPDAKEETKKMGDKEVIFLTATGTYMESSGGPFSGNKTPRENYTMLAAIIPGSEGNVFLKATGPKESIEAMKEAFMAFAASPFSE